MSGKSDEAMRTIGEVAASLDLPAHVLRFWETRFKQINPLKRAGGRRFYRERDIELVIAIRRLLYDEGYTIRGVQRILKEAGVEAVLAGAGRRQGDLPGPPSPSRPGVSEGQIGSRDEDETDAAFSADEFAALRTRDPDLSGIDAQDAAPAVELDEPPAPPSAHNEPRSLAAPQTRILREVLAEIEECKRLLRLTRR
ncbi:MerR family transcriptional regulator [Methylocystis sp. SB2]|uniref:MerR family transcriptional regulator n=1 Tax=Methylocystis sp. (strain SB2) TaxID=743836 RepID=UPI001EFB5746|nr:MerR family transcriptional regulator [Methylocystis sp. SB2]ULO23651.1 MerR family transcriptional regulator [Methylocystis sp. SB2]